MGKSNQANFARSLATPPFEGRKDQKMMKFSKLRETGSSRLKEIQSVAKKALKDLRQAAQEKRLGSEAKKIGSDLIRRLEKQFPKQAKEIQSRLKKRRNEIQKFFIKKSLKKSAHSRVKAKDNGSAKAQSRPNSAHTRSASPATEART
jgi:hypothetical protein